MQNQWYIARDGKQYGPVSDADLEQLVKNREIVDGDFLWRQGFDNWLPAAQVPDIRAMAAKATPVAQQELPRAEADASFQEQKQQDALIQTDLQARNHGQHEQRGQSADAYQKQYDSLGHHDTNYEVQDLVEESSVDHQSGFSQSDNLGSRLDARHDETSRGLNPQRDEAVIQQAAYNDSRYDDTSLGNAFAGYDGVGGTGDASYADAAHDQAVLPQLKKSRISWPIGLGLGIAAILILAVGVTFALPFIVPPETIKNKISSAIKTQTGRDISFKGKISYRFFPSFGIDLNKIVIHNPATIKGPDFVSIGRLQANLKLLPLLSKRVEIERVVLHRPEVTLINDGRGNTNYEIKKASLDGSLRFGANSLSRIIRSFKIAQTFDSGDIIAETLERLEREEAEASAKKKEAEKSDAKQPVDPKGPVVTQKATSKGQIQIGEFEIINGALRFIDQKSNSESVVNAINMVLKAPDENAPVTADGTLRFKEDRIAINANIATLGALLNGQSVKTALSANSDRFEGKFNGQIQVKDNLQFNGQTDVQTFSLQKLLNWFDVDVPRQGYGGAYVRGQLIGNIADFGLRNATIKFDQSTLIGDIGIRPASGSRPRSLIQARLSSDDINLDPYLTQKSEIKRGSLEFYKESQRKTAVAAWSSESFNLSFLKSFDAAIQLDAGRLSAMGHLLKKAKLNAKLTAGLMTATLPSFEIYGGSGVMNLSLNGAKPRPSLKSNGTLKKVQLKPFLTNSAGLEFISGAADITFDVSSAGTSQRALISALNGTGKFSVADGALEGVNIAGILRNLQQGKLTSLSTKPSEKTDFSELSASFAIERGLVKNQDLLMKGPLVRMTGKGIVNLAAETIDYGLNPKLVGSIRGQGGNANLAGIQIPLRLKGPLAKPQILPDTKGLLENNAEGITNTVKTVEKAVKDIKKKKISSEEMKDLLNGMIDGNEDAKNVLDGILQ